MAYPGSAAMSLSDASACLMFSCSVKVVEEEEEGEKSRGERKKTNKQTMLASRRRLRLRIEFLPSAHSSLAP